jgi:hypothetical protein
MDGSWYFFVDILIYRYYNYSITCRTCKLSHTNTHQLLFIDQTNCCALGQRLS